MIKAIQDWMMPHAIRAFYMLHVLYVWCGRNSIKAFEMLVIFFDWVGRHAIKTTPHVIGVRRMIRALYDWVMGLATHKHASLALFAVAFMESSFFPIPPHAMLIPMVLADRSAAWRLAFIATVASVLGGIAGYIMGYAFFDFIGKPVLEFYGKMEKFDVFRDDYNEWGAWIVFFAGVTPFPYKVITLASGVTGLNFTVFLIASIASRGLIFFVICGLLYFFGQPIREFIEKRLGLVFAVFLLSLFGGFILIRFILN